MNRFNGRRPRVPSTFLFSLVFSLTLAASLASAAAPPTAIARSQPSNASSALNDFAGALASVSQYTATVTLFEQSGTRIQRAVYDYTFRKPATVTLHVVSGASAGDTLDWNGGSTVVAHRGSGLFSVFKKTFSLHDPATTTIRGSSIDELGFGAILVHASQTAGTLSTRSGGAVRGEPTETITLLPKNATLDGGYTREVLALSTATHFPLRVRGYEGNKLVREIGFSNLKVQQSP